MVSNKYKRGSIFLITLTLLSVVFILGFAFVFFTGSEEFSSAMTYESEVAFNLAESAVEEFVARLKYSLNRNERNNQLYNVLRAHNLDVSKEIPLKDDQVANLTAYTRETARQLYGIQFGRGLSESKDFVVKASLKLKHIEGRKMKDGELELYELRTDNKEKEGELKVTASVTYKGHEAKISLNFLIRCVKTFVPPFNFFTLYVRDASVYGNSNFNVFPSSVYQQNSLRLDNGWNYIIRDFNAVRDASKWEEMLSGYGDNAVCPPGRVFLGQDLNTYASLQSGVYIRSTNGLKLLFDEDYDTGSSVMNQMNAQENAYLLFDVPFMGLGKYVDKYMTLQGQERTNEHWYNGKILGSGWDNDTEIRILNIGGGSELLSVADVDGAPSFINCFNSYIADAQNKVKASEIQHGASEKKLMEAFVSPDISLSGFHPFGAATVDEHPTFSPKSGAGVNFDNLSPTLIYGPAFRRYFRAVQLKTKSGQKLELPYVASETFIAFQKELLEKYNIKIKDNEALLASEAKLLFSKAKVPPPYITTIINNWDNIPKHLREYEKYLNFMSDEGMRPYNEGLANFLLRVEGEKKEYKGKLKNMLNGPLENGRYGYPYGNSFPKDMNNILTQDITAKYYYGPLSNAMADPSKFIGLTQYDFYFVPRATEDLFRGRTTVAIGGKKYDRFNYKYIDDVQLYESRNKNQTLALNGILMLNDRPDDELELYNLRFMGHGIIYLSPIMSGGFGPGPNDLSRIVINGDLLAVDTDEKKGFNSSISNNMLTLIAPQIVIYTNNSKNTDRCYVEANLISTCAPLAIVGEKPVTIKGTVCTPSLDLSRDFKNSEKDKPYNVKGENVIIYNALNGIWVNKGKEHYLDPLYVAKIVTGGVGKFEWKYER